MRRGTRRCGRGRGSRQGSGGVQPAPPGCPRRSRRTRRTRRPWAAVGATRGRAHASAGRSAWHAVSRPCAVGRPRPRRRGCARASPGEATAPTRLTRAPQTRRSATGRPPSGPACRPTPRAGRTAARRQRVWMSRVKAVWRVTGRMPATTPSRPSLWARPRVCPGARRALRRHETTRAPPQPAWHLWLVALTGKRRGRPGRPWGAIRPGPPGVSATTLPRRLCLRSPPARTPAWPPPCGRLQARPWTPDARGAWHRGVGSAKQPVVAAGVCGGASPTSVVRGVWEA